MRVLILGGDGYLGWPTAMRFSGKGHDVAVVDNFARRRWVEEAGSHSLTPIRSLDERIDAWGEVAGKRIESYVGDLAEGTFVTDVVRMFEHWFGNVVEPRAARTRARHNCTHVFV